MIFSTPRASLLLFPRVLTLIEFVCGIHFWLDAVLVQNVIFHFFMNKERQNYNLHRVASQKLEAKNQAQGNRKTVKRPKMLSKINFRNLKLKSHEEYLICRTYFVCKRLDFQAKSQS